MGATKSNTTTPLIQCGEYWLKRDDLFEVAGVRGGKARTCWRLAQGAVGLVTAGSRASPQVNIVAQIAKELGVPCRAHTTTGVLGRELELAKDAGAEIIQHRAGYNSVIKARAREDAAARGWTEIPFGMECREATEETASQVPQELPIGVKRIVVAVGSGMSLSGIMYGLERCRRPVPVLGVVVGADPRVRLNRWAPLFWESACTLVPAGINYERPAPATLWRGYKVDPIYEAKCLKFLEPGDLFWLVGIRQESASFAGRAFA